MKNKIGYLFLCVVITYNVGFAQIKYDYQWVIAYGLVDTSSGSALLKFTDNSLLVDSIPTHFQFVSCNASMCDASGNLIFYSDGCQVADADYNIMPGGDSINPGIVHDVYCSGYPLTAQSMMSLPSSIDEDKYFLFHLKEDLIQGEGAVINEFLQTTIDMTLNDGKGEVIEANKSIIEHQFASGEITAVKHSDGQSWWLIVPEYKSPHYVTWLLSADTLAMPFFQSVGDTVLGRGNGQAKFSPNGTKYARYDDKVGLQIFDFDRQTGLFSNPQQIVWDTVMPWASLDFSGSGRYLYLSAIYDVFQFDTEAEDIGSSKQTVATWDGFLWENVVATNFWQCERGPDCRIYMTTTSSTPYLGVIMYPDRAGIECDVRQHSVLLPALNYHTIPYHPNYRLDTEYPTCDTSIQLVVQALPAAPPRSAVEVWPNPATSAITLQGHVPPQVREVSVRVYNLQGQQIGVWQVATPGDELHLDIDVSNWPSGIYTYQVLSTEGFWGGGGRMVVAR